MKNPSASIVCGSLLLVFGQLAVVFVPPAAVAQERVLFPFSTIDSSAPPFGSPVADGKGDLYTLANSECPTSTSSSPCFSLNMLIPPAVAGGQWGVLQPVSGTRPGTVNAGLVRDSHGNLYGAATGGRNNTGYVFQIVPVGDPVYNQWTFSVIYNFQAANDAAAPTSSLVIDSAGNLYGASYFNNSGNGSVFQLKPPATKGGAWTESVLYTVDSPTGVIVGRNDDSQGNLFGMTLAGGANGNGLVFELSPPTSSGSWTEQTLYNFPADDAAAKGARHAAAHASALPPKGQDFPYENTLAIDTAGNLYGTQTFGGTSNNGNVFALSPPASSGGSWNFSTLYSFAGSPDGANPAGGITVGPNGVLYGTTYFGGPRTNYGGNLGTVFQLTPPKSAGNPWTEKILRNFTGGFDGMNPASSVIVNARGIFGTTTEGGGTTGVGGSGTVFQIAP
jgi:uncharacterized repeat protein (TIGR03803 family)